MDSLRILLFNWRCWMNPEMGGAEVFTREILKRWVQNGHEVTMFTSKFRGSGREEVVDGVRILRKGGKYTVYWRARECYGRLFSKERYDVVIDEINTKPFSTPRFVKHGESIIALIHQLAREYWFYETPFPISYLGYHFLEERWLKDYWMIPTATVSESSRKDLVGLGFRKIFVVGEGLNFTPLERLEDKATHPVMIFVGRLKKAKRPDHAVRAFEIVKRAVPDAELQMIGDGYLDEKLMRTVREGVRFFKSISNDERRRLIRKAWVLVNPSIREGFGLNVIEANALGVPCVAYDVPGLRDSIVNGETGLLVKSGDVKALADALVNVLTNADARTRLSEKALRYSGDFNWDNVADKFLNIIRAS